MYIGIYQILSTTLIGFQILSAAERERRLSFLILHRPLIFSQLFRLFFSPFSADTSGRFFYLYHPRRMIYEGDRPTEIHNKLTIFLEGIFRQKIFGPHTRKGKKNKQKTDAATVSINNNKKILLILIFKGFNKLENACTQIAYSRQQALHAFCPYVRDISNQFELKPFTLDVRLKLSLVQPPFFPTTKC